MFCFTPFRLWIDQTFVRYINRYSFERLLNVFLINRTRLKPFWEYNFKGKKSCNILVLWSILCSLTNTIVHHKSPWANGGFSILAHLKASVIASAVKLDLGRKASLLPFSDDKYYIISTLFILFYITKLNKRPAVCLILYSYLHCVKFYKSLF